MWTLFCLIAGFLPCFTQSSAKREPSQRDPPAQSIWNTTFATCITIFPLPALCFITAETPPQHIPWLLVYYLSRLTCPLQFIPWKYYATSYNTETTDYLNEPQNLFEEVCGKRTSKCRVWRGHMPGLAPCLHFSHFADIEFIRWQNRNSKNVGQVGTHGPAQACVTGYPCLAPDCLPRCSRGYVWASHPVHTLFQAMRLSCLYCDFNLKQRLCDTQEIIIFFTL